MKKGFALLETIIVITFLAVALILLYNTFIGMVVNNKNNILYDDVANIYKTYYVKEYLELKELNSILGDNQIKEITCEELGNTGCSKLVNSFKIVKMYITKYNLEDYDKTKYEEKLNNYIKSLTYKDKDKYRLIVEYPDNSFASISWDGE